MRYTPEEIKAANELVEFDREISNHWNIGAWYAIAYGPTHEPFVTLAIGGSTDLAMVLAAYMVEFDEYVRGKDPITNRLFWRMRPVLSKDQDGKYSIRARVLVTDKPDDAGVKADSKDFGKFYTIEDWNLFGWPWPTEEKTAPNFKDHPQTIGEIRSDKENLSSAWKPRDVLIDLLRQIDRGELNPDVMIVCFSTLEPEGGSITNWRSSSPNALLSWGTLARVMYRMQL